MARNDAAPPMQISAPDPALKRLEKLVGTWELKGRTLDLKENNSSGWNTFEWMPDGFFLKSFGEINFKGFIVKALEIIAYDAKKKTFSASVYSKMSGTVHSYEWDIRGNTIIHMGLGATYTGIMSDDGKTITGGWRPDKGTKKRDGASYDAVMTRIK